MLVAPVFYLSEPSVKLGKSMCAAPRRHASLHCQSLHLQPPVKWGLKSSGEGNTEPSASGEGHAKSG